MNDMVSEIIFELEKMGKSVDEQMDVLEYWASIEYLENEVNDLYKVRRKTIVLTIVIFIVCAGSLVYKFFF